MIVTQYSSTTSIPVFVIGIAIERIIRHETILRVSIRGSGGLSLAPYRPQGIGATFFKELNVTICVGWVKRSEPINRKIILLLGALRFTQPYSAVIFC